MENNVHNTVNPNTPASRNWLPIIIIVAIVVIGLVAWAVSSNRNDNDDYTAGSDSNMMVDNNQTVPANNTTTNTGTNTGQNTAVTNNDKMGVNSGITNTAPEHMMPAGTVIPAMRMEAGVKVFTIVAGNFYFGPSEIKVNKGDKVKIVLDNKDGFHDFVLNQFNVRTKQMQGPSVQEVSFTADKTGTFEYYCSVGKHRAMGMKGNLIVQ